MILLPPVLFALAAVCATQSARAFGPERANALRLALAIVVLGAWAHAAGAGLGGGAPGIFILAGALGFGAGGWCMFQALPRLGSTLGLLVVESAAAVTSATFGWVFLGAALTPVQIGCAALALGGVAIGLAPYRLPDLPRPTLLAGAGFAVLAAVGQGASWTLSKHGFQQVAAAGAVLDGPSAAYQRLLGGLAVALAILAARRLVRPRPGSAPATPAARPRAAWLWPVGNALAGPVLGVTAMLWAIRGASNPGLVQAVAATATLLSLPLARRLEGRRLGPAYFAGVAVSLSGISGLLLLRP